MQDHYRHKDNWLKTLESWNKKKTLNEGCKSKTKKKAIEDVGAGAVSGAVTAGQSSEIADDGGYDSDDQKQIARFSKKVGKKKTPQTRTPPERLAAKESVRRVLDRAYQNALYSESISIGEDEDELMGAPDELEDMDEPVGDDEIEVSDEPEVDLGMEPEVELPDMDDTEVLQLHDPELGVVDFPPELPETEDDISTRLDRIEGMLQQLVGEEVPEVTPVDDTMDIAGVEEPVGVEMEVEPIEDPSMDTELPPVEGSDELPPIEDLEDIDDETDKMPESDMREGVMSEIDIISREALDMLGKNASEMDSSRLEMFVKENFPNTPDNWIELIIQRIGELSYGDEDIGLENKKPSSWKDDFFESRKDLRLPIIESLLRD